MNLILYASDANARKARNDILHSNSLHPPADQIEALLVAYVTQWPEDAAFIGAEVLHSHVGHHFMGSMAALLPLFAASFNMVRRLAPPGMAVAFYMPDFDTPTLLVAYLERAHLLHPREFRPMWRDFYHELLGFVEPADRTRLSGIAKAQWWFMQTEPSAITVADIHQHPDETMLALLWNTHLARRRGRTFYGRRLHQDPRMDTLQDVLEKLQTVTAAKKHRVDSAIVNLLLHYVVAFIVDHRDIDKAQMPAEARWEEEQTYMALVRTTIELGADPLHADFAHGTSAACFRLPQRRIGRGSDYQLLCTSSTFPVACQLIGAFATNAPLIPIGSLVYAAEDQATARMLAVAMASHPRLGRGSLLGLIEPEFVRTYMVPAARCSVTIPRSPEASYALALRRRLLFDAGISLFDIQNPAVLPLFGDSIRQRTPLTPALIDNFRALPRQP